MFTASMLLVLTSCNNKVVPTNVGSDVFKDKVRSENGNLKSLEVKDISVTKYGGEDKHRFTVEFNMPVTDSVETAVSFYKLTNAAAADKAPVLDSDPIKDVTAKVDGKFAYFTVPTKGIDWIYAAVNGSSVQAINGQYMNQDGDTEWAEEQDDKYVDIFDLNSTPLTGNPALLDMGSDNLYFGGAIKAIYKYDEDKTNDPGLGSLINKLVINDTSAFWGVEKDDLENFIKKHIRIEQYTHDDSWKEITPEFTYDSTKKEWTAPLDLDENTKVRLKVINAKSIQALKSSKYKYDIKFTLDSNIENILVYSKYAINDAYGDDTGQRDEFVRWDINELALNNKPLHYEAHASAEGVLDFVLTPDNLVLKKYIDAANKTKDVTPKMVDGYYKDFAGFDNDTVKVNNFKLMVNRNARYTIGKRMYLYGYGYGKYITVSLSVKNTGNDNIVYANLDKVVTSASNVTKYPKAENNKLSFYYTRSSLSADDKYYTLKNWYEHFVACNEKLNKIDSGNYSTINFEDTPYSNLKLKDDYERVLAKVKELFGTLTEHEQENLAKTAIHRLIKDYIIKDNNEDGVKEMLKLSDTAFDPVYLYISPEVKTDQFTGQYTNASSQVVDINITPLNFATYAPSNYTNNEFNGWAKVDLKK